MQQQHNSGLGNQSMIAAALDLTPARVSQLVAQGIFAPDDSGMFNREQCEQRYALFKSEGLRLWDPYLDRVRHQIDKLQLELDLALAGEIADPVRFNSVCGQTWKLLSETRFMIAVDDDASTLILFDHWASGLRRALVSAGLQLLADMKGVSYSEVIETLRAEANGKAVSEGGEKARKPARNKNKPKPKSRRRRRK